MIEADTKLKLGEEFDNFLEENEMDEFMKKSEGYVDGSVSNLRNSELVFEKIKVIRLLDFCFGIYLKEKHKEKIKLKYSKTEDDEKSGKAIQRYFG